MLLAVNVQVVVVGPQQLMLRSGGGATLTWKTDQREGLAGQSLGGARSSENSKTAARWDRRFSSAPRH